MQISANAPSSLSRETLCYFNYHLNSNSLTTFVTISVSCAKIQWNFVDNVDQDTAFPPFSESFQKKKKKKKLWQLTRGTKLFSINCLIRTKFHVCICICFNEILLPRLAELSSSRLMDTRNNKSRGNDHNENCT